MKEDQKKKLEELTKLRKEKTEGAETSAKELMQKLHETREATKSAFYAIRKIIFEFSKKAKEIVASSGDSIEFYSNDHAKNLADQTRTFAQLLYYLRGRSKATVGVNTPSIVFEALLDKGKLKVSSRTSIKPAELKVIVEEEISNFNNEKLEEMMMDFIEQVMKQ